MKMNPLIFASIFLGVCSLVVCAQRGSPPTDVNVERPRPPYSYGEAGVYMDERQRTRLTCTAEGNPEPSFVWRFNGVALISRDGVNGGVLTIDEPARSHEGVYQCSATNGHGTTLSRKYNLVLSYQGQYSSNMNIVDNYIEGHSATIRCAPPTGAPAPTIYWNSRPLYTDRRLSSQMVLDDRVQYTNEGDLFFANVLRGDEKSFACFATNSLLGAIMRSPLHNVFVSDGGGADYPAEMIHFPGSRVEGLRSEAFKMVCLAAGLPTPHVHWLKDGVVVSNTTTLLFEVLAFENYGSYACLATNDDTTFDERKVELVVVSAPYFKDPLPFAITLAPGESRDIHCNVEGRPMPSIQWLHNGQELSETAASGVYTVEGSTLVVNNPREGDSTYLQCVASNTHGEALATYIITIQG